MDLQARIRVRPGGARGEQLRHARLDIAALAAVLRARRGIAQFARHHEIDEAHRQLVGDARKMNDRLAELLAGERSEEHTTELQSLMRNAYDVFGLKKTTTKKHT